MKTYHSLLSCLLFVSGIAGTSHAQQQYRIDIDSTQINSNTTSGSITTEAGWTSLDATSGNGASVTVDGMAFEVTEAATNGSRRRTGGTALNRDFIFDRGEDKAVGLKLGVGTGLPEGRWKVRVWMWDVGVSNFEANIMQVGWKVPDFWDLVFVDGNPTLVLIPGTEYLIDDQVVPVEDGHAIEFSFYNDHSRLLELFVRENNPFDRSRINAVELTRLDVGMDDSNAFALDTRNSIETPEFPVNTRHPDIIHNTGLEDTSPGSFPISMAMLKVTGGATAMDNTSFRLLAQPLYGTLRRNGTVLNTDQVFTQAQIDAGQVTYERPAGTPHVTDVLEMSAVDQSGNGLVGGSLFFIVGNAGEGSSGLVVVDTRNREDSDPLFTADTRGPDVIVNTGIPDPVGGTTTITMAMFQVTGGLDGMDEIKFTLLTAPMFGALKWTRTGVELEAGDMFTQTQVDAGDLVYERDATGTLPDPFELEAEDESGYGLAAGSVTFVVGDAGSTMFAIDTRNFSEFGTHTVHTDNRVYVTPDTVPGSLRQAVSNASNGETVDFDPGVNGATLVLTDGQLELNKDISVDASALPGSVTVSGNSASRVFDVFSAASVTLDSLNLTGGNDGFGGTVRNAGTLEVMNSTIQNGSGFLGAGLHNTSSGDLTLSNTTVAGNISSDRAGGIYNDGSLTLNHSTVAANAANGSFGGGIFNDNGSTLTLTNSVVAGNLAASGGPDMWTRSGIPTLHGRNLFSDISGSGLPANASLVVGDARLAPLNAYGNGTRTMPPLPGSPVIDAALMLGSTPSTDQRGAPRPGGPFPDIGAVEAFPFCYLNLVDSDGDGIDDRLESAYAQFTVGINDHALDSDGDGVPDWAELDSMTDPLDEADYFRFKMFPSAAHDSESNPEWTFQIKTFPGLIYQLEHSGDLNDFVPMPGGQFTATGDLTELNYLLNDDSGFHRIKLVKP